MSDHYRLDFADLIADWSADASERRLSTGIGGLVRDKELPRDPLSQREYVQKKGTCCPACGSHEIEGRQVDVDGGYARQDVLCNDCLARWTDTYILTGYTDLESCKDWPEPDEA